MSSPHPTLFRVPEPRTRTQGGDGAGCGKNGEWERQKAVLLEKRFNAVPLCTIKPHFVTIDSGVRYGIMKEICPEFNVRKTAFTSENRTTHWKNIFDFKRLKTNKGKKFARMIETDGVAMCVHCRRLKADRPVPSSASSVTNYEDE